MSGVLTTTHRVITYTYDALYKLTGAEYSTGEYYQYTCDPVGNRLSLRTGGGVVNYQYDDANRLTRYWRFDNLPPCRRGVAFAWVHFTFLASTLVGLYRQETEEEEPATLNAGPPPLPMPEYELAVYAGPYFTLLLPSELMQIVLSHMDAWKPTKNNSHKPPPL